MAKRLQLRRGSTLEHSTFTGAVGEPTYDTEAKITARNKIREIKDFEDDLTDLKKGSSIYG